MKQSIKYSDNGVSPVIAVILILMLTITMVAVFVVGVMHTTTVTDFKVVGATISQYTNGTGSAQERGVTVTLIDSGSNAGISELWVTIDGVRVYYQTEGNKAVSNPQYNTPYNFFISAYDNQELNNVIVCVNVKYSSGSDYTVLTKTMSFAGTDRVNLVKVTAYAGYEYDDHVVPGHGVYLTFLNTEQSEKYNKNSLNVTTPPLSETQIQKSEKYNKNSLNVTGSFTSGGKTYSNIPLKYYRNDGGNYYYYIPVSGSEGYLYTHISNDPRDQVQNWNIKVYVSSKSGEILNLNGELCSGSVLIADTTLDIPEREGYDTSGKYSGSMTLKGINNSYVGVKVTGLGNYVVEAAEYYIKSVSGEEKSHKSYINQKDAFSDGYNEVSFEKKLDLSKYSADDKFEVYLRIADIKTGGGANDYTHMWYYLGNETIEKLRLDYQNN